MICTLPSLSLCIIYIIIVFFFFFQAEDGIRDLTVTGVQTCALPISPRCSANFPIASARPSSCKNCNCVVLSPPGRINPSQRSEEHTSELQSQSNLVCRLLLEKKKKNTILLPI